MAKQKYQHRAWDDYASNHASVSTCFQDEVYRATAALMSGSVADFGCGSGKIAPYLGANRTVNRYTGFDASREMVKVARALVDLVDNPAFNVQHRRIEIISGERFDSALSINSFYAWAEPEIALARIADLLNPGATFVLATPNPNLDMEALLAESRKALIVHPHLVEFARQNRQFANNPDAGFVTMDEVVALCRLVGFKLVSCHQQFFLAGLNFLHLQK